MSMVFAMRLRLLKVMGFLAIACAAGCSGDIASADGWLLSEGGTGASLPVPSAYGAGAGGLAGSGATAGGGVSSSTNAGTTDTNSPERTPEAGTGGLAGSGVGTTQSSGETPSFAQVFELLSDNCAGCHGTGQGGLTLRSSDQSGAYTALVNASSVSCAGLMRVVPGDPDNSVLYLSIVHTVLPGCEAPPMPSEFTSLDDADALIIRNWIAGGAPSE